MGAVYALRRGAVCLVSVPAALATAAGALRGRAPDEVFRADVLAAAFGATEAKVVGPAYHGHCDAADFRPAPPLDGTVVRELTAGDAEALEQLRAACAAQEWKHSGIGGASAAVFGCFRSVGLVGAAKIQHLSERVSWTGVITHPAHRGTGCGLALVSACTDRGLELGRVMHYQTLAANGPAVAIARRLGYRAYGMRLAVRFTD